MVDRFEDLYRFNIEGNFKRELEALRKGLASARDTWAQLRSSVNNTATFAKSRKEIAGLSGAARRSAKEVAALVGEEKGLISASDALGGALNKLTREQNALSISREKDLITLQQARRNSDGSAIKLRAEARALRRLTTALEEKATASRFQQLASEAGLKVSADGKRLFDAEALAAERNAKAQNKLALARQLNKLGIDAQGNVLPLQGPQSREQLEASRNEKARTQFNRELERLELEKKAAALRKNSKRYRELNSEINKTEKSMGVVNTTGKKVQGTFNRISFTFRRLIGIMAAFTIARTVVRGFNSMIATAVRFQAALEKTRVGLTGLIAAAAEVRGEDLSQLDIGEQLEAAQNLSIDQMRKLRSEALQTAASYEELAFAFQTAIAPGLQAGLTLDQVRGITVDISQAATALGVAQNQLAEEIRSLLQGTITPRNTRVATALGISNEDIRSAKELGRLAEFLNERFAAISANGQRLMETFEGSLSNALDAFKQLLGEASGPLFEQLKGAFQDIQQVITELDVNGETIVRPEVVEALEGLFEGLARGVRGIRAAFSEIDARGVTDAFGALGEAIGLIATSVAGVFKTAFNLASPLVTVVRTLLATINSLVTLTQQWAGFLGPIALTFGRLIVLTLGLRFAFGRIAALSAFIKVQWGLIKTAQLTSLAASKAQLLTLPGIQKAVIAITNNFKKLLIPILAATAAITLIDAVLAGLGVEFSIFDALAEGFQALTDKLDNAIEKTESIGETATEGTEGAIGTVIDNFRELRSELEDVSRTINDDLRQAIFDLSQTSNLLDIDTRFTRQLSLFDEASFKLKETESVRKLDRQLDSLQSTREVALLAQKRAVQESAVETRVLKVLDGQLDKNREKWDELTKAREQLSAAAALPQLQQDLPYLNLLNESIKERNQQERKILAIKERGQQALKDQLVAEVKIKTLNEERLSLERNTALVAQARITEELLRINRDLSLEAGNYRSEILKAQASVLEASGIGLLEVAVLEKEADLIKTQVANAQRLNALERTREVLAEKRIELQNKISQELGLRQSEQLTAELDKQDSLLEEQIQFLKTRNKLTEDAAKTELELARLRKDGTATQGIGFGLQGFAQENLSSFNVGERFGQDLANGVTEFAAGAISESVAAAFDPNRNFELREAAGNFLLGLGTNLLEDFLKQQLATLITEVAGKTTDLAGASGQAAILKAGGVAAGVAMTQSATRASFTLAAGGTSAAEAMVIGAIKAAGILEGATAVSAAGGVTGGATGGAVSKMILHQGADLAKTHNRAPGFAVGGRPRTIDARDTIPAWLRPGEWVIRPESVRKYGDSLFDMLNRGRIDPSHLKGLSASAPTVKSSTAKRSFATGGKVEGQQSSSSPSVLSLQFFDEQTMDRAFAAGRNSAVRFARKNRSEYRAALGLEPGS